MKKFKVSISVPCYKSEPYLPKCLDTLLEQTLDGIEVIAINDGSPDNCLQILKEYKKKFKGNNELVIIDKENEGVWKGRYDAIAKARGEYIGFIDVDDYVSNDYAEKLYNAVHKNKADIAICGFDRIDLDTGKLYSREMCKFKYDKITLPEDAGVLLEINGAPWNKMFKAEVLKNICKLNNTPGVLDDIIFNQLAYLNSKKIVFINESLYYYMVRKDSIINTINLAKLPGVYATIKEVRDIYSEKRPELLKYVDANAFLHLGVSLMYRLYGDKNINFNKVFKENIEFLNNSFPNWISNNEYLTLKWVNSHRKVNKKLWIIKCFYKTHLFKFFLFCYTFMIKHIGIDIKW